MNCVERFTHRVSDHPDRCAIWMPSGSTASFRELESRAASIQAQARQLGLKPGEPVLLLLGLGLDLYASVIGLLASGHPILLVEPWMPVSRIEGIITSIQPRGFLAGSLGKAWGLRSRGIRSIRHWFSPDTTRDGARLSLESLDPKHLGILTFTSGTTGEPKGVVRTHGYLWKQLEILEANLHPHSMPNEASPDWCIFANFALANLASGRPTILMSPRWPPAEFRAISELPPELAPASLTCGPSFLRSLLDSQRAFPRLNSIHVGGALTDCALFERAFAAMPSAEFTHVYGSTEAEPVAKVDARVAVRESRQAGLVQTLCLGTPVSEIRHQIEESRLWVAGDHVCPKYLGAEAENRLNKRQDGDGTLWHNMGDRVRMDASGRFWYAGRSQQPMEEFRLEQEIYSLLGHTEAFVHHARDGSLWLLGNGVVAAEQEIRRLYPEVRYIENATIRRDPRHRARIDRLATMKRGAPWLVG